MIHIMKTCNEILGNQGPSKIRSCSDVLNDNSLQRSNGYINFNYFTDFLDVDIDEIEHIPAGTTGNNFYAIKTLNEEYIKATYLNFIYFISLDDFSKKFNKIYLERQDHFKLYFKYLNTLGSTYKPMDKGQLRNIILAYSTYAAPFYRSLSWIDTSEMKDMSYLFQCISMYYYLDISKWDVSNVRDMRGMFYESSVSVNLIEWELHPIVKLNKKTFKNSDVHESYQFKILQPYYKRFCKYYTKIIYKKIKMFFNYD